MYKSNNYKLSKSCGEKVQYATVFSLFIYTYNKPIMVPAIITHIEYSHSKEVTLVRCKPSLPFSFKEWQFMMITSAHVHEGLWKPLKKPYSIATTNAELQQDGTVGFVVKKSREWFMSDYLTTQIAVGDTIYLQWPAGHMVDQKLTSNYLLISVGSGLSPMVSLYIALQENPNNKIANLFGERYHAHVLPSVEALFSKQSDNVYNQLFLSKEENLSAQYTLGYIQDGLEKALQFLGSSDISVFICGKPEMVDDVKRKLIDTGIEPQRIKAEKY